MKAQHTQTCGMQRKPPLTAASADVQKEQSQTNNPLFYLSKLEKGKLNPKQMEEEEIMKITDKQNRETTEKNDKQNISSLKR